ncbi:helix-turn-helix domain-containing protein [Nocardia xishanensis]|uniref:PucR family transcriptional regulator n=1 Tax=Nocardia xishanensis TaxID=238964 RepID=A0ABW7X159_9NOCA
MVVSNRPRTMVMAGERPISTPLHDVHALSKRIIESFAQKAALCEILPAEASGTDLASVIAICLESASMLLDGRDEPDLAGMARLEEAAAEWAREEIPLDSVLHAIFEGSRIGHRLVSDANSARDFDGASSAVFVLIDVLDTLTTIVTMAYLRELRAISNDRHAAKHTLTTALLSGNPTGAMARHSGIAIADSYVVLAVSLPTQPDENNSRRNREVAARRRLRKVQAELATRGRQRALSLLSLDGGTILIPAECTDIDPETLIEQLSSAGRVPITATVHTATTNAIPEIVDQLHQLLDVACRLRAAPGLYRFKDLALEYQLSRPGPGRDLLVSVLDRLEEHPELLETLHVHVGNHYNRRASAKALYIHVNTLDNRLRRIAAVLGFDPCHPSGIPYMRAALLARELSADSTRSGYPGNGLRAHQLTGWRPVDAEPVGVGRRLVLRRERS